MKLNPKDNPLGISVYKLGAKDGKGSWFARRSIHEGLEFEKWKKGLEREFCETMKDHGRPGQGNIRGIGAEKRVEYRRVTGIGKIEVYLLSAQFPGPTAPRDFVTMFLTSDQLPQDVPDEDGPLRHFMVISRPCVHKDTAPRDGYVRGQYESVEYIREIPMKKPRLISASTTDLKDVIDTGRNSSLSKAMLRSSIKNRPREASKSDDSDDERAASDSDLSPRSRRRTAGNPVEWIMITRSDPGGSVPRFMVERGTPNGIVTDASKFLDWANSKNINDFDTDEETPSEEVDEKDMGINRHMTQDDNEKYLGNFHAHNRTDSFGEPSADLTTRKSQELTSDNASGLSGIVPEAQDGPIPMHIPAITSKQTSAYTDEETNFGYNKSPLRHSKSSISSLSSDLSFASALEVNEGEVYSNATSTVTTQAKGSVEAKTHELKQLNKLDRKKRKLDEKLNKAREKEANKRNEDSSRDEEALRKAEEKHKKEIERLERKKQKELRKAEEKRRKTSEKDDKARILKELEDARVEANLLRTERESLKIQVADLQAANKALVDNDGH